MDTRIFFGIPGQLIPLYHPLGGVQGSRLRQVSSFATGSGGVRTGKSLNGVRTYTLDYGGLDYSNFALLEAFDQGHMGAGPFALLDPGRRNLLTVNQSASCGATNDVTDFVFLGGSGQTLTADPTVVRGTPRTLKWTSTATGPAIAQIHLMPSSIEWPGIPVVQRPYSWGYWVLGGGSDPIVTLDAQITWLNASGTPIGSAVHGATVATSTGWQFVKLENTTPPSGTAFMDLYVNADGTTISNGTTMNFAGFQANEGETVDAVWTPGTGVMPVQVMALNDKWVQNVPTFRQSNSLVLQEVGW